jgi:hypothetical protein
MKPTSFDASRLIALLEAFWLQPFYVSFDEGVKESRRVGGSCQSRGADVKGSWWLRPCGGGGEGEGVGLAVVVFGHAGIL